jgi:hypothetical protein
MEQLYNHFKRSGYTTDQLFIKSGRYVSIWQQAKPEGTDDFKGHGLLPLGILDYQSHDLTHRCMGCHRDLPQAAYSKAAWKEVSKRQCWVCRAISVRKQLHKGWDRDSDGYGDDSEDDYRYTSEGDIFGGYDSDW